MNDMISSYLFPFHKMPLLLFISIIFSPLHTRLVHSATPAPSGVTTSFPTPSTATNCSAGEQVRCIPCPGGTYSPSTGSQSTCFECQAGTYSLDGASVCSNCAVGYYSTQSGLTTCSQCPAGQTSNPGSTYCSVSPSAPPSLSPTKAISLSPTHWPACPAGTFHEFIVVTEYLVTPDFPGGHPFPVTHNHCKNCPVGTFMPVAGYHENCTLCSPGMQSINEGSISCSLCPLNHYNPYYGGNSSSCLPCPVHHIAPPGSTRCYNWTQTPTGQPSSRPSLQPSRQPSSQPSAQPISRPSSLPTGVPTKRPSQGPSSLPSSQPSGQPISRPSSLPTGIPSGRPTRIPSSRPSGQPSGQPISTPSSQPTMQPSSRPSTHPTSQPSSRPTGLPTKKPSQLPSARPSSQPSAQPITRPSSQPSGRPTSQPSFAPSSQPSSQPSVQPTHQPTVFPSSQPSDQPSAQPLSRPSSRPSMQPTSHPSVQPSSQPSSHPSSQPFSRPSSHPTSQPSSLPSSHPSSQPAATPSSQPTSRPSGRPSSQPSVIPSSQPSIQPISHPTSQPSRQPTSRPSSQPIVRPSSKPTAEPSANPTAFAYFRDTIKASLTIRSLPAFANCSTKTQEFQSDDSFVKTLMISATQTILGSSNVSSQVHKLRCTIVAITCNAVQSSPGRNPQTVTTNVIHVAFNISYNLNTNDPNQVTSLPTIIKSTFNVNTFTTVLQQNAINYGTQYWLGGAAVDSTQSLTIVKVDAPLLAAQKPFIVPSTIPSLAPIITASQAVQVAPIAAGGAVGLLIICVIVVCLIWYLNRDDRPKRAHLEMYDQTVDGLEFGNVYGGDGGKLKSGNDYEMTLSPMSSPMGSKLSPSRIASGSPTHDAVVSPRSPFAKSAAEVRKSVAEKRKSAVGLGVRASGVGETARRSSAAKSNAIAQLEESAPKSSARKSTQRPSSPPPPPPPPPQTKPTAAPVPLRSLTVKQVAALLRSQSLDKFIHAFATAKVSGAVLFEIQDNKDLQEINIFMPTAVGFAFVKSLAGFRENGVPASMLVD